MRMGIEEITIRWRMALKSAAIALMVVSMALISTGSAHALSFDLGEEAVLDLDTTLSYSAAWRVEDQNEDLLAMINTDDGNRNFKQWDMVNNRFKIVMEGDLSYKDFGAFARGRAFYDFAYMGDNSNDSPETLNNSVLFGGSLTDNQEFSDKTQDRHGQDVELLDAYLYGAFNLGNNYLDLRVGRQAVSWGESLFLFNSIMTAMSPLDATEANVPGVEARDLLLPVGQAFGSVSFLDNFTLAAYYQWEWDKTRLNESGAYFGIPGNFANDAVLEAGENVLLQAGVPASIDHIDDNEAKDDGQYGFALRYVAEALNSSEFGLYFINYHEKLPTVGFHPLAGTPSPVNAMLPPPANFLDASGYSFDYAEDVKLLGFSMGTVLGGTEVGFETTYRQDYPINIQDPMSPFGAVEDGEVWQAQLSFRKIISEALGADQWAFAGEVGYNTVFGFDGDLVEGNDKDAWGFVLKVIPGWNGILQNLDLEVPLTANINPSGTSVVPATFTEDANSFGIAFDFTYRAVYKFGINYTMYTGSPKHNSNTDRDFVGFNFKYTF